MSLTAAGRRLDTRIAAMAERTIRRISRRDALRGTVVSGTAALAALSLGERPALAENCACGPTRRCAGCRGVGCPAGYSLCKGSSSSDCFNKQGYRCEWPNGTWIACMNAGRGYGYKVCYDCKNHNGCKDWCTCLSECICCKCASVADIRAEQHRIQALDVQ
jgi:hypothetical protein